MAKLGNGIVVPLKLHLNLLKDDMFNQWKTNSTATLLLSCGNTSFWKDKQ